MAPHFSTLAWKIPWMEEPGRLQSMGSLRVRHDWATSLSFFTFMHWRRKWQPTPVFLPGESQGWGSLVGCRLWNYRVGHDWSDLAAADLSDSFTGASMSNAKGVGVNRNWADGGTPCFICWCHLLKECIHLYIWCWKSDDGCPTTKRLSTWRHRRDPRHPKRVLEAIVP